MMHITVSFQLLFNMSRFLNELVPYDFVTTIIRRVPFWLDTVSSIKTFFMLKLNLSAGIKTLTSERNTWLTNNSQMYFDDLMIVAISGKEIIKSWPTLRKACATNVISWEYLKQYFHGLSKSRKYLSDVRLPTSRTLKTSKDENVWTVNIRRNTFRKF